MQPDDPLERFARAIALIGGLLSLVTAGVVVVSVLGRWTGVGSVQGDFELVQMATAISVFCFLPLCQVRRGNIMVDTFTGGLTSRTKARIDAAWDIVYATVMLILAVSLAFGAVDVVRNGTNTMVLGLSLWPAIMLASALTFFLAVAAFVTGLRLARRS